jgi:uncharacterized protein YegL
MNALPGGPITTRPLHFIWILDTSGSMIGSKIQSLNFAIKEAIQPMQDTARQNPHAQVLVRAVKFSTGAHWHLATPTPVADFKWTDLSASGVTDMGMALTLVAEQLRIPPMTDRALPPVLILISDGRPTDDFGSGLKKLMAEPWAKRAVRLAIAVGRDADLNVLSKFIGHRELAPLQANNSAALVNFIKWASTAVLQSASSPASQPAGGGGGGGGGNVPIPTPPQPSPQPPPDSKVW